MSTPFMFHAFLGLVFAVTAALAAAPTSATGEESAGALATRDCLLFVGAELKVKDDAGWHRVIGVDRGFFIAEENGKSVRIAMDRPNFEFTFERVPKVAVQEVALNDVVTETAFSPQRDPQRRWLENQSLAMSNESDDLNAATRQLRGQIAAQERLQAMVGGAAGTTPQSVMEGMSAEPAPNVNGAMRNFEAANWRMRSEQFDPAFHDRRAHDPGAGHDALRIEGVLRAPLSWENPYVVAKVEFTMPDHDDVRHRILAEPLPATARNGTCDLSFLKPGFPEGFKVKSVALHFFENGHEIPTPNSDRRTAVSRSDALQFVVLDRLARQRKLGEATPGSVVAEMVKPEVRKAWAATGRTCFVRVSSAGMVEGVFADSAGTIPLGDPLVEDLIAHMGFRPAISAEGEAVTTLLKLEPLGLRIPRSRS